MKLTVKPSELVRNLGYWPGSGRSGKDGRRFLFLARELFRTPCEFACRDGDFRVDVWSQAPKFKVWPSTKSWEEMPRRRDLSKPSM